MSDGSDNIFPQTQWSLVARAGAEHLPDDLAAREQQREALGVVLTRYLPALRVHLRGRGISPASAENLLQSFVADRVIEKNMLAKANRSRGRFRSFLLTSLDNYVANWFRSERAAKRSPTTGQPLSLDPELGVDAADAKAPAPGAAGTVDTFDVAWAREALAEALRRMQNLCTTKARPDLWDVFETRILRHTLEGIEPTPYEVLAARHGYAEIKPVQNLLMTAKRWFGEALRSVLMEQIQCMAGAGPSLEFRRRRRAAAGAALTGPGFGRRPAD